MFKNPANIIAIDHSLEYSWLNSKPAFELLQLNCSLKLQCVFEKC